MTAPDRPVWSSAALAGCCLVPAFPQRRDQGFAVRNGLPMVEMIESFELPKT